MLCMGWVGTGIVRLIVDTLPAFPRRTKRGAEGGRQPIAECDFLSHSRLVRSIHAGTTLEEIKETLSQPKACFDHQETRRRR